MLYIKPDLNKAKIHFSLYEAIIRKKIENSLLRFLLPNPILSAFLNDLLSKPDNESGSLFELITASPIKIEDIINRLPDDFSIDKRANNQFLKTIFSESYETNLDKIKHINSVGQKTCPYCNQNFIIIDQTGKGKHEIDHYYPQSSFPYLAMSYFNLVPCCRSCNNMYGGKGKSHPVENKKTPFRYKIYNPYDSKVKTMSFHLEIAKVDDIWENKFKIDITPSKQGLGYENIFNLKSTYKHHNDYIQEIYLKSIYLYSATHKDQLNTWLLNNMKTPNQIELYRFLYGFYDGEESHHLRPLSKMAADLMSEIEELIE